MLDAGTQARFAKSCSDAMVGYANATTAAYASVTSQAFDMWAAAFQAMMPKPAEPRSWYRHPDERARTPAVNPFLAAWGCGRALPAGQPFAFMFGVAPKQPEARAVEALDAWMAPWSTWLAMWSGPRAVTAWPMAFVMVANGMPQAVAVPAAEAHAAALDAAGIAADQLTRVYSVYRSESGYATAQVIAPPRRNAAAATTAPAATPSTQRAALPMWPWLH